MKVKVLTRNPDDYLRETKTDLHKVPRNYNPDQHPFEAAREYVRALNAVKLEKVFAKPFVGNLAGHKDGVSCLGKHPKALSVLASGSYDGEVKLWDLAERRFTRSFKAHDGFVRGITFNPEGSKLFTVGDDKTIKIWDCQKISYNTDEEEPLNTIISKYTMTGISHHRYDPKFLTSGDICQLWDESRFEPIRTFQWGNDTVNFAAFNQVETFILATCGNDRSIVIYDTRKTGPVRKVIMNMRTNQLCWNPMEAYIFTCANEDYNLYSYDSRNLKSPIMVHKDHVAAITSIDYAPTGREFVSGSYDKTIRLYLSNKGHSREIYHTKRMQHVTNVLWSLDNKYVISASDEMNVRIWKARAAEKLGILNRREKMALEYNEALKKKFESHPQIKRIARHRKVPRRIQRAQRELRVQKQKLQRKEANVRKHSKPGSVPYVPERASHTVSELE